jgi:hypothetical protein
VPRPGWTPVDFACPRVLWRRGEGGRGSCNKGTSKRVRHTRDPIKAILTAGHWGWIETKHIHALPHKAAPTGPPQTPTYPPPTGYTTHTRARTHRRRVCRGVRRQTRPRTRCAPCGGGPGGRRSSRCPATRPGDQAPARGPGMCVCVCVLRVAFNHIARQVVSKQGTTPWLTCVRSESRCAVPTAARHCEYSTAFTRRAGRRESCSACTHKGVVHRSGTR